MARNNRRRAKKLQARKAKRKEQRQAASRFESQGMRARVLAARKWPVIASQTTTTLHETGMGNVLIARRSPDGRVAAAMFLLDTHCLGVKDVLRFADHAAAWANFRKRLDSGPPRTQVSPEYARKLVEQAVEYAASYGLKPHSDYAIASLIFGDIDASQCLTEFAFGVDGKPHYCAGPYESIARMRQVLQTLVRTAGVGQFCYTLPVAADEIGAFPDEIAESLKKAQAIGTEFPHST